MARFPECPCNRSPRVELDLADEIEHRLQLVASTNQFTQCLLDDFS